MAFFGFYRDPQSHRAPDLQLRWPSPSTGMAKILIFAGSVGVGRPNQIKVTTSAGDQIRGLTPWAAPRTTSCGIR